MLSVLSILISYDLVLMYNDSLRWLVVELVLYYQCNQTLVQFASWTLMDSTQLLLQAAFILNFPFFSCNVRVETSFTTLYRYLPSISMMEYIIIYKCIFKWTLMKPVNCVLISCLAGNFYFFVLFLLHVSKSFTLKEGIGHFVCEDGFYLSTFFYQHIYFVVAKFPCLISLWFWENYGADIFCAILSF